MTNADLRPATARILTLKTNGLDDLVHYVQDERSYNGETMRHRQYQDLITVDMRRSSNRQRASVTDDESAPTQRAFGHARCADACG
jgi:hypothetical protein